jgi:hypothetical protein
VGEFKEGKANGKGILFRSNGDKLIGRWRNDKQDGTGIMMEKETGTKYIQQNSQVILILVFFIYLKGKLIEQIKVTADWSVKEVIEWALTIDEQLAKVLEREKIRFVKENCYLGI